VEATFGRRSDAPNQPDREGVEKVALILGCDRYQTVGFGYLRCDLGEMLGPSHTNRQRQTDFVADASADGGRDLARRSEKTDGAPHIEEGLVDRDPLDSRGEVREDGHDIVAKLLVALEVATDEQEFSAELASLPPWHATADAIASGFIRCGQDHTAANRDGPVPQGGVQQLLDGRVEGIEVGMQDGRPPARRKFHTGQGSRTYVRFPE